VHGAVWDSKRKCWKYPLLWQVCLELRSKLADPLEMDLELDEGMSVWAYAEKERQAALPDVLGLEAVKLDHLPTGNPELFGAASSRPFQTVGIKFGAMNREVLLADDPGLGKTMQTIGMFQEARVTGPILVVAPKSAARITWPNEIRKWTEGEKGLLLGVNLPPRRRRALVRYANAWCLANPGKRLWVVTNPYYLRTKVELDDYGKYVRDANGAKISNAVLPEIFTVPWAGIVVDESHTTLAGSTGNAKKWSQQRLGLGALRTTRSPIRVAISGTPFRGKPENLFGTLQWLRPKLYTSYWKWVARHFEVFEDPWGAKEMGGLKDEDVFYKEAANVMIRRSKSQVAPDLPSKMYGGTPLDKMNPDSVVGVWLPMEPEQSRQYYEMVKRASVELEGGNLEANGVLAEMTRLKQFSNSAMKKLPPRWKEWSEKKRESIFWKLKQEFGDTKTDRFIWSLIPKGEEIIEHRPMMPSNKIDWIEEFLTDRDLVGKSSKGTRKVIISSQFTGFINLLSERLNTIGVRNYVLTGETSDNRRVQIANDFQKNPKSPKVFLVNTRAGGVSLTLDQADDVIICDETFIPDDQLQVEDRAHRLSRIDHNVTIWYLRSLGTIEEGIGATTTEREKICRALIDGARGVDHVRLLVSS
jgi:SNF2 family DNA or RNA helicase